MDTSRGTTPSTSPSGITMLKKAVPFRVRLGESPSRVIAGWEAALPTMSLGERATFRFGPEKAYGDKGKGAAIPPGATLEYDMELVGVDGKYFDFRK